MLFKEPGDDGLRLFLRGWSVLPFGRHGVEGSCSYECTRNILATGTVLLTCFHARYFPHIIYLECKLSDVNNRMLLLHTNPKFLLTASSSAIFFCRLCSNVNSSSSSFSLSCMGEDCAHVMTSALNLKHCHLKFSYTP